MSILLSYTHHLPGPVRVFVEVPGIPLEITVTDDPRLCVTAELAEAKANLIQIGPAGPGNAGVRLRAVNEQRDGRRTVTSVLPGAVFSRTSSAEGSTVMQCGGDMTIGGREKKPGAYLTIPIGTSLEMKAHGVATVKYHHEVLGVVGAAVRGLFEMEGNGEADHGW